MLFVHVEDIIEELVGEIEDEHDTVERIELKKDHNTYVFSRGSRFRTGNV